MDRQPDLVLSNPAALLAPADAPASGEPPLHGDDAFHRLTRLAMRVFGADWAMLALIEDEHEVVRSVAGIVPPEFPWRVPLPRSLCRFVVERREPAVFADLARAAEVAHEPALRLGVRAYLGVPLAPGGDDAPVAGVLCIARCEPCGWGDEDARTLADIGALATAELERRATHAAARQGEETLAAAATMMHALVEQSLAGIYVARDERLTYVNPGLAEIFGASREALTGRRVLELVAPEDRAAAAELLRGGPDGAATFRHTFRARRADGGILHLEVHGARTESDDGIAAIGVVLDVTERVRAELEREAARTERDRFFAVASHELRTPLSAIVLFNELLVSEVYGPLNEAQRDALTRVKRSAEHLMSLINDLLDLSKLQAGRLEARREPVDVAEIVTAVSREIAPLAQRHGCEVRVRIARRLPCATADVRRVRQIVLNLLSNAVKYGGGHPVEVRCLARRGEVIVEVADRGPGIAPADQERIWDEFVQLGGVAAEGTGLGLPIARRLARMLGGRIELQSEPGAGSTFRLVLPR